MILLTKSQLKECKHEPSHNQDPSPEIASVRFLFSKMKIDSVFVCVREQCMFIE